MKIPLLLSNRTDKIYFLALVVFFVSFVVYLKTICPTVYWFDSGEIITAVHSLGLSHPPSFPLYNILVKPFTFIPIGEIAFRTNLASAVFGVLTIIAIYAISLYIFGEKWYIFAAVSALILSFTSSFWLQSIRAEVYTLNSFLIFILVLLTLVLHFKPMDYRLFYILSFLYGLSLGNHSLLVLMIFPALLYLLFKKHQNHTNTKIFVAIFFILLGLSIYLYLPIRSSQNPILEYREPDSFNRLMTSILKKGEYHFFFTPSFYVLLEHSKRYIFMFMNQFTFFYYWIGIIGIWQILKKNRETGIFLILLFFFNYLVTINSGNFYLANYDLHGYAMISFAIYSIWIGYGMVSILRWIDLRCSTVNNLIIRKSVLYIIIIFLLLPPFLIFYKHLRNNEKSNNYLAYDYGMNMLRSIDENALFITAGDNTLFSILFLKYIYNLRPDTKIIHKNMLISSVYRNRVKEYYHEINLPARIQTEKGKKYKVSDIQTKWEEAIISSNLDNYPIYLREISFEESMQNYVIPQGIIYKMVLNKEGMRIEDELKKTTHMTSFSGIDVEQISMDQIAAMEYGNIYLNRLVYFAKKGMLKEAIMAFKKVIILNPNSANAYNILGSAYAEKGFFSNAIEVFKVAIIIDTDNYLVYRNIGQAYIDTNNIEEAIKVLKKAVKLKRDDAESLNKLGLCYAMKGIYKEAKKMWIKAQQIAPDDSTQKNIDRLIEMGI